MGISKAKGPGCVFKADLLWRTPALLKLRQGSLRQQVENTATTVVDRNDDDIATLSQRQAAKVVLAGQVAEQRDNPTTRSGDADGCRNVAVNTAGSAIPVKVKTLVATPRFAIQLANGQRVTDENRCIFRQRFDQNRDMGDDIAEMDASLFLDKGSVPARRSRLRRLHQFLGLGHSLQ